MSTEDLQPGMYLTKEMMDDAGIPSTQRDRCVHLLLPLNQCRKETFSMPWACTLERTAYHFCQYKEYFIWSLYLLDKREDMNYRIPQVHNMKITTEQIFSAICHPFAPKEGEFMYSFLEQILNSLHSLTLLLRLFIHLGQIGPHNIHFVTLSIIQG